VIEDHAPPALLIKRDVPSLQGLVFSFEEMPGGDASSSTY